MRSSDTEVTTVAGELVLTLLYANGQSYPELSRSTHYAVRFVTSRPNRTSDCHIPREGMLWLVSGDSFRVL